MRERYHLQAQRVECPVTRLHVGLTARKYDWRLLDGTKR
jgi:hypothetical protein